MIPVALAPEPAKFDDLVRRPGLLAIAEMVGREPIPARRAGKKFSKVADREEDIAGDQFPSYWERVLDDLMIANPALPDSLRRRIQDTIETLGLNDYRRAREKDAERYWAKGYSLEVLKEESPFVARELHRQGRLNPGEVW